VSKRFVMLMVACVAVFIGVLVLNKHDAGAPNGDDSSKAVQASNHTYGDGKKGVTLVEYGDLQCPACGQYFPLVKQIKEEFKGDITFQFRHFPLIQIHPSALLAAKSAEAAGLQGKFFEMHDLMYENQTTWSPLSGDNALRTFESYASGMGLDLAKFKMDATSDVVNSTINADIKEGKKLGANATPTFVLDGKKLDQNPRDLESFRKLIQDAIAAKNKS
jgi:protein-disulfide isomerase